MSTYTRMATIAASPISPRTPMIKYSLFLFDGIPRLSPLRLLPFFEVFDTLQAMPAQPLAVNASVEGFPSFASEHQTAGQIAAPAAGC